MKYVKMMIAIGVVFFGVSVFGSTSAQAQSYGTAGCGLGSMLFGEDEGMIQIFAATTNGLFATQTFGITSGTSNCVDRGVISQNSEQEAFFEMNYDALRQDMAAGQGEHLLAMGSLLGCSAEVQSELGSFSQAHYEQIFPSDHTTANQALYSYKMQLSQQEGFAQACARL